MVDVHEPEEIKKIADEVKDLGFDFFIIGSERAYVVERKTLIDMIGSLHSKDAKVKDRLYEQLLRIRKIADELIEQGKDAYPVLILEGNHFKRYNARFAKMTPAQWMGIQARVVEMGIGMIRTWTTAETVLALQVLDNRAGKSAKAIVDVGFRKELRRIDEEAMHMIMAISGVGGKKAEKLFNRFGTVKNIVCADRSELIEVVGERLGEHIYSVVNCDVRDKNEKHENNG